MSYCPKCGVELDLYVKNCPLCSFPIPDLGEEEDLKYKAGAQKYPKATTQYKGNIYQLKNAVFFSVLFIAISGIIIVSILKAVYPESILVANYILMSIIAVILYLFFALGYLKTTLNVAGVLSTTMFITYAIDYQIAGVSWSTSIAFPIIGIIFASWLILRAIYKNIKNKNLYIHIPSFILIFSGVVCIGIDFVLSYQLKNKIAVSWSIIVAVCAFFISTALLVTYHGLSEKNKEWLKRKLHV